MECVLAVKYILILNATSVYNEYLEIEDKIEYKSAEAFNACILFTDGSLLEESENDISTVFDEESIKNVLSVIKDWKDEVKNRMSFSAKKTKLKKRLPSFTFFSSPERNFISIKNEVFILTIDTKSLTINGFIKINE